MVNVTQVLPAPDTEPWSAKKMDPFHENIHEVQESIKELVDSHKDYRAFGEGSAPIVGRLNSRAPEKREKFSLSKIVKK